jgi:hypothetical protein
MTIVDAEGNKVIESEDPDELAKWMQVTEACRHFPKPPLDWQISCVLAEYDE